MDLKEMKNKAINLYREGKTIDEIDVPVSKEIIEKWIKEENSIKIKQASEKIEQLKKQVTPENKTETANKISTIALEVLELDNNNKMAINEMLRCYMIKREYNVGRIFGQKALEANPNSTSILYTMAELELRGRNAEKALEYNAEILSKYPNDKRANEQKKKIEERLEQLRREGKIRNRTVRERREEQPEFIQLAKQNMLEQEQQEFGKKDIEKVEKYSLEEEQEKFAKQQVQPERYSPEAKKEYMDKITKMFLDGQVNNKKLAEIKQELYKYPNNTENALFLSELFYTMQGNEQRGIHELEQSRHLVENEETLESKISDFRKRIDAKEYIEKQEDEKKTKIEQLKKEQREYSREIIKRIDKGELTKEEIPEVVANLEKYPDRTKALYLITKLYQGYYGTKEAREYLVKYSYISDLTLKERADIESIRFVLAKNENKDIIKERQLRIRKRNKEANKRYKDKVRKYLKEKDAEAKEDKGEREEL